MVYQSGTDYTYFQALREINPLELQKQEKKTTNQKTKKTPPPQTKKKKERTGKENDMLLTKYRLGIYENYSLMPQPKLSVMVPHYTDFSS